MAGNHLPGQQYRPCTYGNSRGDIRLTLSDRDWEEGEYFVLVSNLEENPCLGNFIRSPYGYTLLPFTLEYPETGEYEYTDEWENLDKKDAVCEDGTYVLPEMEVNGTLVMKNVEINSLNEVPLRIISQGCMPLKINFTVNTPRKTFRMPLGIYRVGQALPLWSRCEWVYKNRNNWVDVTSGVLNMCPGKYFLLVGGVVNDEAKSYPVQTLNGCVRYDFEVLPHGKTLSAHPAIECIEVHPCPLDEWKEYISAGYLDGPSARIAITFSDPDVPVSEVISVGCLDEYSHLLGSCRHVAADGTCTLNGILPLLSGHYRLVVCHNGHPWLCGHFSITDGKVPEVRLSGWDADGLPARIAAAAEKNLIHYPGRETHERLIRIVNGQEPMPDLLALTGGHFSHMKYIYELLHPKCEIIERSVSELTTEVEWKIPGMTAPADRHIVLCIYQSGRLDQLTPEIRQQLLNAAGRPDYTVILYDEQDATTVLDLCPEVDVCIPASCRWSIGKDTSLVSRRIGLWERIVYDEERSWDELDDMV